MSDLMTGTTTWASGTADTASALINLVDEKRAEHINGMSAFVVALQAKLGTAASLIGGKTDLATRLAVGIDSNGILTSAQPGDMKMSAVSVVPSGWLLCDGSAVSRSTYAALYAAISTTYGAGDGSTTFNVPDMRGRVPLGVGIGTGGGSSGTGAPAGGSALTAVALGTWKGEETHLLTGQESGIAQHNHGLTDPGHAHNQNPNTVLGSTGVGSQNINNNTALGGTTGAATTGITINNIANTNAASAHNNVQPATGVNFFIKT